MCGRYTLKANKDELKEAFQLDDVPEQYTARYNIAPSQPINLITSDHPKRLSFAQWGLIPRWAKDPAIGNKMINARSETLSEKASFKSAYKYRRCLIPATGFYEWKKEGKAKKPYYIHFEEHKVFAMAGLWETWNSPDGSQLTTCTIITTNPNDLIKPLHHRMAVILSPDDYGTWLDKTAPQEVLQDLMQPYTPDVMRAYEVSTHVNSVATDAPDLIEPYSSPTQKSLF